LSSRQIYSGSEITSFARVDQWSALNNDLVHKYLGIKDIKYRCEQGIVVFVLILSFISACALHKDIGIFHKKEKNAI